MFSRNPRGKPSAGKYCSQTASAEEQHGSPGYQSRQHTGGPAECQEHLENGGVDL